MKKRVFTGNRKHIEDILLAKGYKRNSLTIEQEWFQHVISVSLFVVACFWWRYRIMSAKQLLIHSVIVLLLHGIWFGMLFFVRRSDKNRAVCSVERIAYIVETASVVLALSFWQIIVLLLETTEIWTLAVCAVCVFVIAFVEQKISLAYFQFV